MLPSGSDSLRKAPLPLFRGSEQILRTIQKPLLLLGREREEKLQPVFSLSFSIVGVRVSSSLSICCLPDDKCHEMAGESHVGIETMPELEL